MSVREGDGPGSEPNHRLRAVGVGHCYGDRTALADVAFDLTPGVTALVGVNGAGKSTLLRVLAGSLRPSSGQVTVAGLDPYRFRQRRRALGGIALMPQVAQFPPNLTVREVVTAIGWLRGMTWTNARRRAAEVVDAVALGPRATTKVGQLSGGMARRVALAQALVSSPQVLLLDEPSTGLDPEQRRTMVELLRDLDTTVLLSSHVMEDVEGLAQRVLVLDDGALIYDGTVEELQTRGRPLVAPGQASLAEAGFLGLLAENRGRA